MLHPANFKVIQDFSEDETILARIYLFRKRDV